MADKAVTLFKTYKKTGKPFNDFPASLFNHK